MPARNAASSRLTLWLALAVLVVVLDQLSKVLIMATLPYGAVHYVTACFDIVHAHNPGAAFSFLAHAGGWQRWFFVALAFAAATLIGWLLKRHGQQTLFAFALSFILGGALGNVIDRLVHGFVVDFIQVHWGAAYFPAFNLADSAITLGAILLVVDELRRVKKS